MEFTARLPVKFALVHLESTSSEALSLLSYTLRYVSLVDSDSEALSLLSYTLRYVSLTDLDRPCQVGLRHRQTMSGWHSGSEKLWCNFTPIVTKSVEYYALLQFPQETILHPTPQCITVRYRKSNGLNFPTRSRLQRSETGRGIFCTKEVIGKCDRERYW
jgi:hypothetical protein